MNSLTDPQLLRDYTERRSEPAFAELVRRHVDLVYSAALRMVRDAHLAEDVTQGVFVALAQNARQLTDRPVLSGWLHRTAQNLAANAVRANVRRRAREQEAVAMNDLLNNESDATWDHIAPHLDAALGELSEPDRDAVLLRYFERQSAREMAQALGVSDEAAQKRVNRAVERLREFFTKRGVTVGATGLVVISTNAVQAAPVGLAATIATTTSLAGTSIAAAATKTIAMTALQKTLVTITAAVLAGAGIYEARQNLQLRASLKTIQQQRADELHALEQERDTATNRLAGLRDENDRLRQNTSELLKLRNEIARTREAARPLTPTETSAKSWAARVTMLKQKLEQMPERRIPELQFATEKDWANATWEADLSTDDGVREALSRVREEAENTFLNLMRAAIKKYTAANAGTVPDDITQLKSYFDPPVQDAEAMLKRYKLLQTGKLSDDHAEPVARLATYADDDYDSNHMITMYGASGGRFNRVEGKVTDAARSYVSANHGQMPSQPSDLEPYLSQPLEEATIESYLKKFLAEPPPSEVITLNPILQAYSAAHNGQGPENSLELVPYLTTPEQQAAFIKLEGLPAEAMSLAPALKAYTEDHNGKVPKDPSDLLPYLTTPEQQTVLQKIGKNKKPGAH